MSTVYRVNEVETKLWQFAISIGQAQETIAIVNWLYRHAKDAKDNGYYRQVATAIGDQIGKDETMYRHAWEMLGIGNHLFTTLIALQYTYNEIDEINFYNCSKNIVY